VRYNRLDLDDRAGAQGVLTLDVRALRTQCYF
jgi:hypothetical protein